MMPFMTGTTFGQTNLGYPHNGLGYSKKSSSNGITQNPNYPFSNFGSPSLGYGHYAFDQYYGLATDQHNYYDGYGLFYPHPHRNFYR